MVDDIIDYMEAYLNIRQEYEILNENIGADADQQDGLIF